MADYREKYNLWTTDPFFDEDTRQELLALTDEKEIEDRFYRELEFGTGGARGIMGAGSNRMNIYNIRRISTGFALFLLDKFGDEAKERGIAIAFDSRNNSAKFAKATALTMAYYGIPAYLYTMLSPTPLLSFTVRDMHCVGGVVVTASHNTKEYNGYKAYDEKGCQLYPDTADAVIARVESVDITKTLIMDEDAALKAGLLRYIGEEEMLRYEAAVQAQAHPLPAEAKADLKVVYTPLHGAGNIPIRRILAQQGYTGVQVVKEQAEPNGDFPTVKSPNPGEDSALALAVKLAEETGSDIVVASDPDADRIGMAARGKNGFRYFSGNQMCAMLIDYVLTRRADRLKPNSLLISTVVTSEFGSDIARKHGLEVVCVLTGFKFIGEMANRLQDDGSHTFEFGYEESNGCLVGNFTRDKDSASAIMLMCEMAAWYKAKGLTLEDALENLYKEYGYYLDHLDSFVFPGKEGAAKIKGINARLREIGTDLAPDITDMKDYAPGTDGLPPSDVLKYWFADGSWLAIRPSGTEPKIKVYYCIHDDNQEAAAASLAARQALIQAVIDSIH